MFTDWICRQALGSVLRRIFFNGQWHFHIDHHYVQLSLSYEIKCWAMGCISPEYAKILLEIECTWLLYVMYIDLCCVGPVGHVAKLVLFRWCSLYTLSINIRTCSLFIFKFWYMFAHVHLISISAYLCGGPRPQKNAGAKRSNLSMSLRFLLQKFYVNTHHIPSFCDKNYINN